MKKLKLLFSVMSMFTMFKVQTSEGNPSYPTSMPIPEVTEANKFFPAMPAPVNSEPKSSTNQKNDENDTTISAQTFGKAFVDSIQSGDVKIVRMFINNPLFSEISATDSYQAFKIAIAKRSADIVELLMNNITLSSTQFGNLLNHAMLNLQNSQWIKESKQIIWMFIHNPQFKTIRGDARGSALAVAAKVGDEDLVHALMP